MNNRHAHTDEQYRQERQQAQGPYGAQFPWHIISLFLLHSINRTEVAPHLLLHSI
jgi:hypothetical protein